LGKSSSKNIKGNKVGITSKITRNKLALFLKKHTTKKLTLNLGSGNTNHCQFFPNIINLDIKKSPIINIVGDAHTLPIKKDLFKIVLATELIEHVKKPQVVIDEIFRVLKSNGKLILSTRFAFPLHETPNDYYRFTKYGIKYLFRDWKKVTIVEEANTKDTIAVLLQRIAYQTKILTRFPLINLLLHLTAKIIHAFPNIIYQEYGDIRNLNF